MTRPLSFSVLVDSQLPATDGERRPLLSRERGADRLADALSSRGHDVIAQEMPLAQADPNRWILYFGGDVEEALRRCDGRRTQLERRLVPMDEDRFAATDLMDALPVPFVVTARSFRNWLADQSTCAQVDARSDIARRLGISTTLDEYAQPHFQFMIPNVSLPEGIVLACAAVGPV